MAKKQHIKIEPGTENAPQSHIKRHDNIFIKIVDLANTIHCDQTGTFPFTSQCGNMVHNCCNPHQCKLHLLRNSDKLKVVV
jgi:hypothetical protein